MSWRRSDTVDAIDHRRARRRRLARALVLLGAVSQIAGCAGGNTVRYRVVKQTGCRIPGYPADLKARGLAGSVVVRYVVDADGRIIPDSNHTMVRSDSGFVDSAWAAIRSCHFLPRIVDGHAVATTMFQLVSFFLPQPTERVPIEDMAGPPNPADDSIEVDREEAHRLRRIASYVSFTNTFGAGAETICLFLGIAFGATRLGWRRPLVVAFGVTTVVVAGFVALLVLDIYEPKPAAGVVRIVIVSLVAAALHVGAVASTFKALAKASLRLQVAGSALVAILAVPAAILLSVLAACIIGLGCV
jgi:TonB family protein